MNRLLRPLTGLPVLLALAAAPAARAAAAPVPAAAPAAAPAPVEGERLAIAEEVVALAFPVEQRQAMLAKAGETMMAQMRAAAFGSGGQDLDSGAAAILDRYFGRIRARNAQIIAEASAPIFVALARAYARSFTRDELIQIRAFIATPAGAKYLRRSTEMLSDPDVAAANTIYFQRVMSEMRPLQAELVSELAAYFKKHPPAKQP